MNKIIIIIFLTSFNIFSQESYVAKITDVRICRNLAEIKHEVELNIKAGIHEYIIDSIAKNISKKSLELTLDDRLLDTNYINIIKDTNGDYNKLKLEISSNINSTKNLKIKYQTNSILFTKANEIEAINYNKAKLKKAILIKQEAGIDLTNVNIEISEDYTGIKTGIYGSIFGRVTTPEGKPAVGATVQLLGTVKGAFVKGDGTFLISNIEAGVYDVKITFVGMEEQIIKIRVNRNSRKKLDVRLKERYDYDFDHIRVWCGYPELVNAGEIGTIRTITPSDVWVNSPTRIETRNYIEYDYSFLNFEFETSYHLNHVFDDSLFLKNSSNIDLKFEKKDSIYYAKNVSIKDKSYLYNLINSSEIEVKIENFAYPNFSDSIYSFIDIESNQIELDEFNFINIDENRNKSSIPYTFSNNKFKIALSPLDSIKINKELKKINSGSNFFGFNYKSEFLNNYTIINQKSEPIKLIIKDNILTHEFRNYKYDILNIVDGEVDKNLAIWELNVEPNSQKEFELKYEVKHPEGVRIYE